MNKKWQIIATVCLITIISVALFFSLRESKDPIEEFAQEILILGEDSIVALKNIKNKEDLKSIYKKIIRDVAEIMPEALAAFQKHIDKHWDGEIAAYMDPNVQEKQIEKYKDIYAETMVLFVKGSTLINDKKWNDSMEEIVETMNEDDASELITFTIEKAIEATEEIASNPNALSYLNESIKIFRKEIGINEYYPDLTKQDLLDIVQETKVKLSGKTPEEIGQEFALLLESLERLPN